MSLASRVSDFVAAVGADVKTLFARSLPSGGATGRYLRKASATDYAVEWGSIVFEEHVSFSANGAVYFRARRNCVISSPVVAGAGTPSVAYSYAADGVTFPSTPPTFPLTMAAGSQLRITLSGFNTWATWDADRT